MKQPEFSIRYLGEGPLTSEALDQKYEGPLVLLSGSEGDVARVARGVQGKVVVLPAEALELLCVALPELGVCVVCGPVPLLDEDGEVLNDCPNCEGSLTVVSTEEWLEAQWVTT